MVTVIKKGASKKSIEESLKRLLKRRSKKGIDAHKYCGTVKFKEDAVTLQKSWRDEWD